MHFIPPISATFNQPLTNKIFAAINNKTKPIGSLGILENIALQLGLIQETVHISLIHPTMLVFAGDHGITDEGVSAFPQEVTWQMVENFLAGGAAINVFAKQNGFAIKVIDCGVKHNFGVRDGLVDCKIAEGTNNFLRTTAMTSTQCATALSNGRQLINSMTGNIVGFGEMGIGNTTSAAALMHILTTIPLENCVGAGTGLHPDGIRHKQKVIQSALQFHQQRGTALITPLEALTCFGGFEIATMVGAMLAAAERRMTLLIDGFIVTSALLVAAKLQANILDYCIFAHQSDESGHAAMLQALDVQPILQLNLRLGEGTGAALVYPLVQAAANFMNEMATFTSAKVSDKEESTRG